LFPHENNLPVYREHEDYQALSPHAVRVFPL